MPLRARDVCIAVLGVVVGALVGVVAGLAAMGTVAMVTTSPPWFLFAGTAVFATVVFTGAVLATTGYQRRRVRLVAYALSVFVVASLVTGLLWPMGDPQHPPAAVANREVAELPTGSNLSYVEAGATGERRQVPIVVLHGGPGVPDMKSDVEVYRTLADDGFDVYVYEQAGAGRSDRLSDPREYGLERDVADLEAFRRQVVSAPEMVVIGHGAGARLAAAYLAEHADRVRDFVAVSPQSLAGGHDDDELLRRLGWWDRARVLSRVAHPRLVSAHLLTQVDPRAARAYVGDAELDARLDRIYARTRPALHCAGKEPGPALRGLGFFAHQYPRSRASGADADVRPALREVDVPTLVVKGACDYLPWSTAAEYTNTLPEAQTVFLEGAGHVVARDAPRRYLALVRAFLTEAELPVPPYQGEGPPPNYAGPP